MEEVNGHQVARAVGITVDPRIRAVAFIPDSALSTAKARKLLPDSIPHAEAVANSTRSALLVQALSLQPELLFTATEDFLHQKYRQSAMPKSFALVTNLRSIGVAAFISGAGPTVLVLHTGGAEIAAEMRVIAGPNFEMQEVEISPKGATLHTS